MENCIIWTHKNINTVKKFTFQDQQYVKLLCSRQNVLIVKFLINEKIIFSTKKAFLQKICSIRIFFALNKYYYSHQAVTLFYLFD